MSVDLTTSPGGLFRRLGKLGYAINSVNLFLGSTDLSAGGVRSVGVFTDNVQDQFEATRQDLTQGLYSQRDSYRGIHASLRNYLRGIAQNVVIEMVNDDTPLASKTLTLALTELISQMVTAAASVPKPTVSATPAAGGSNTGTGVCAASVLGPNGLQLDYAFPETLKLTVTSDSQGTATAASEPLSVAGAAKQADELSWDWPLGSAASGSLTAVDASLNNSANVLQNSSWATFTTANTPDNWPISVGSAGSTILQATGSNAYKGASGLAFVGNGSELTSVQQPFSTTPSTSAGAGGTSYKLLPSTVYAVNCWVKCSATPAAGVLSLALVDGSGTILNDANSVANNVTLALTGVSTSFVNLKGFFRTPAVMPAQAKLRVRLSTALENAKTVYIDHLALTPATRLYSGGPYAAVFSGATEFVLGDKFTVAVANDWATTAKWALLLEKLFGLRDLGLAIPSNASPTITDSYIA